MPDHTHTWKQTHPPFERTKYVKEKPRKCCLENVLLLLVQKSQESDLPTKNQISKPLQMKKTKIDCLLVCL
jgi:hypothetical protein